MINVIPYYPTIFPVFLFREDSADSFILVIFWALTYFSSANHVTAFWCLPPRGLDVLLGVFSCRVHDTLYHYHLVDFVLERRMRTIISRRRGSVCFPTFWFYGNYCVFCPDISISGLLRETQKNTVARGGRDRGFWGNTGLGTQTARIGHTDCKAGGSSTFWFY